MAAKAASGGWHRQGKAGLCSTCVARAYVLLLFWIDHTKDGPELISTKEDRPHAPELRAVCRWHHVSGGIQQGQGELTNI